MSTIVRVCGWCKWLLSVQNEPTIPLDKALLPDSYQLSHGCCRRCVHSVVMPEIESYRAERDLRRANSKRKQGALS